jgi:CheY-like chemotaxis protein
MSVKKILLVDDDEIFNFISTKTLENLGLAQDIHSALNGQDALTLINDYFSHSRSIPDVILLDLNMPVMDGFGFLEAIKKLNLPGLDRVKIIVITSSQNPRDIERVKQLGIKHYLTKPISPDALLAAIMDN